MCEIKRKQYRFGNSSELLFSFRGQIVRNNSKVVYTFFFGQLSLAQYLQWFLRMSLAVKQPNRSGPHRTFIKSCKVTASDLQRVTAFEIHCRHFLT